MFPRFHPVKTVKKVLYISSSKELYTKVTTGLQRAWYRTGDRLRNLFVRLRQRDWPSFKFWSRKKKDESWGLEETIPLPATGTNRFGPGNGMKGGG